MQATPCPLCGYDAPEKGCIHCELTATEPSLDARPPNAAEAILAGFRALPTGLFLLLRTRGVKRFLIPPLLLTLLAFGMVFWWFFGFFDGMLTAILEENPELLDMEEGWMRSIVEWLISSRIVLGIARLGEGFFFLLASSIVALYMFSIVYEAVAGPFLDEIQGRIETNWFGADPRNAIQRPNSIPVRRCVILTILGTIPLTALCLYGYFTSGPNSWIALAAAPSVLLLLALFYRDYGEWLWWVIRIESGTLWVSVKAALLTGLLLVCFFWLKFIPVVGPPLFFCLTGFATAISLLDIPFSRRCWSTTKRFQFMLKNALPLIAFGVVSALLFIIPVIGPIAMVPAASIGGLWLLCRLDKNPIRPKALRFDKASLAAEAAAAGPVDEPTSASEEA